MEEQKLYVVVRKDLPHSQRAVQAGHGLAEFLKNWPSGWSNGTLVYLRVQDEGELLAVHRDLTNGDIKHSIFREPDIGNEMTSLASLGNNSIFEQLPLL